MKLLESRMFFQDRDIPVAVLQSLHDGHSAAHMHDFYEFVYLEKGLSMHTCMDRLTILLPGDLFGVRPMEPHEYTRAKDVVLYNILFDVSVLEQDYFKLKTLPGLKEIFQKKESFEWRNVHLPVKQRVVFSRLLDTMLKQQSTRHVGWELVMKSALIEILVLYAQSYEALSHLPANKPDGSITYVYKGLTYIEENYQHSVSIGEIADFVGITADYLTKCFKRFVGLTPVDYIRHFKLAKSVELLKDPEKTIAQVAFEIGFDDHTYFSRLFRQVFGMSPSDFKNHSIHAPDPV